MADTVAFRINCAVLYIIPQSLLSLIKHSTQNNIKSLFTYKEDVADVVGVDLLLGRERVSEARRPGRLEVIDPPVGLTFGFIDV